MAAALVVHAPHGCRMLARRGKKTIKESGKNEDEINKIPEEKGRVRMSALMSSC